MRIYIRRLTIFFSFLHPAFICTEERAEAISRFARVNETTPETLKATSFTYMSLYCLCIRFQTI